MKNFKQQIFLVCGLLLTLAAFPAFAQEVKEVEINKRPFQDLRDFVKQKVETKKVDLNKSFSIELEGVLTKEGKLDQKKSKFTKSEGDAAMIEVGKSFIEAVNDSGMFGYLKSLGIENLNFALVQDENQIYANIVSEVETSQSAMTISTGLNFIMKFAQAKNNEMKNLSEDEKILINGLKASNNGKILTINLAYDKSVVQEMIKRKLKESEINQLSE